MPKPPRTMMTGRISVHQASRRRVLPSRDSGKSVGEPAIDDLRRAVGESIHRLFQAKTIDKTIGGDLENRLDFGVDGDMRGWDSVDREFLACNFRKLEKAADVIILIITGEQAFRFRLCQTKGRKRNRLSELAGPRTV